VTRDVKADDVYSFSEFGAGNKIQLCKYSYVLTYPVTAPPSTGIIVVSAAAIYVTTPSVRAGKNVFFKKFF